jgi:NDP-sugar pyrophosphorylase family protein
MSKIQVVVLAGGLGSRLEGYTNGLPKPMVEFGGAPFLEKILLEIKKHSITEVTLAVGYRANTITSHFLSNWKGVRVKYSIEDLPLGTGGALLKAMDPNCDIVLLVNGDTFQDIPLAELVASLDGADAIAAVGISSVSSTGDFGCLELDKNSFVSSWKEKSQNGQGIVYSGVAAISTRHLKDLSAALFAEVPFSFEEHVVPALLAKGKIKGVMVTGLFYDIGTPARLSAARENLVAREK